MDDLERAKKHQEELREERAEILNWVMLMVVMVPLIGWWLYVWSEGKILVLMSYIIILLVFSMIGIIQSNEGE